MPYCSYQDVETRIGAQDLAALADHDGDGVADLEVVEQAIASAQAVMDSYLGIRFAVPVGPAGGCPAVLTTRAANLAVYFLKLGRDSVTDDARKQYEDDVSWLSEVAAGRADLGIEPLPAESERAPTVRMQSETRLFGRREPL